MTDRVRTTALSLAWTLAACHRATGPGLSEPTHPPGPIAESESAGETLAIVPVLQQLALETSEWVFDPSGRMMASTELGDCSIWDIESGRLMHASDVLDGGPCETWEPAVGFDSFRRLSSPDEKLEADTTAAGVDIIDVDSGRVVRSLACSDCIDADDMTWSTDGRRLAFAWQDPPRVDIWDVGSGQPVQSETIPISGELMELELGWTQGGATVAWTEQGEAIECEEYSYDYDDCEYDEDEQMHLRRPISVQMMSANDGRVEHHQLGSELDGLEDLEFNPSGHWVYWVHEWSERRGGTTVELHFASIDGSGRSNEWESYESYNEYGESITRDGSWHEDGALHWMVSATTVDYDGSPSLLEWESTVMSPPLGRRSGTIASELGYEASVEIELYGITAEGARVVGEVCEEESCTPLGPTMPPDCTMLDIGSGHGAELLDCGNITYLRNAGGPISLPLDPGALEWWWARGGTLALYDGTKFMVVDASSGVGKHRQDVTGVLDGRLGPELNRLLVLTDAGAELIDLAEGGKPIMSIAALAPEQLALSPSGDRMVVVEAKAVRVLAIPSGEELARIDAKVDELAFRQDGKLIYVGDGLPERAFDASSGKPVDTPALARIADAIDEGGELDPTWRWIVNDEFDQLVRTLDGLMLEWTYQGAWIPSTGLYVGTVMGLEVAFRVGSDPWQVPEFDAADLSKWLVRPDLIEAFLLGRELAAPALTPAELFGLRTAAQGRTK